jgi:hypothetical protein
LIKRDFIFKTGQCPWGAIVKSKRSLPNCPSSQSVLNQSNLVDRSEPFFNPSQSLQPIIQIWHYIVIIVSSMYRFAWLRPCKTDCELIWKVFGNKNVSKSVTCFEVSYLF